MPPGILLITSLLSVSPITTRLNLILLGLFPLSAVLKIVYLTLSLVYIMYNFNHFLLKPWILAAELGKATILFTIYSLCEAIVSLPALA